MRRGSRLEGQTDFSVFKRHVVILLMCMCMGVFMCVQVPKEARASHPPELELQEAVSCLMCVLGPELGSSARGIGALNL